MALPVCECGIQLKDYRSRLCRSCSKKGNKNPMTGKYGTKHPRHKGGYIHNTLGYKLIMDKGIKVYEHRKIVEEQIGRKLKPEEVVHHLNHNKTDNRIENLKIMNQADHVALHKPMLGKKSKVKRNTKTQRFSK